MAELVRGWVVESSDDRFSVLIDRVLRRLSSLRTDTLRSKAAAELLTQLPAHDAMALLARLLRMRRDVPAAAAAIDAVARALIKEELDAEFVESIRTAARSRAERLVEALLASGPAVKEYDRNAEVFVDRRLRALTLGERRAMSRSRDIDLLVRLAHDQDVRVITGLLQNPRITEREAVLIASRRPTQVHVLEAVLASRFGHSRRVRRAVAHNPYSPVALAVRAMSSLTTPELEALAEDEKISTDARLHARTLIVGRRPTPAERTSSHSDGDASDDVVEQWITSQASELNLDFENVEWVAEDESGSS